METKVPRWLELAREFDSENLRPIEIGEELSNNGISIVGRGTGGYVYKRSIPFLIQNELYCLQKLYYNSARYDRRRAYVPRADLFDKYTIRMEDLGIGELVINAKKFMPHKWIIEEILKEAAIRHGDLTTQAIIVRDQKPYLIDFAESRLVNDPRLDKRSEGDAHWLDRTFMELCKNANSF